MIKNSLNPDYAPKDATFDFPLYLSLAEKLGVLELVLWDKDTFKKDYLGEVAIPLEDWFRDDNAFAFDDPLNKVSFAFTARVPVQAVCEILGLRRGYRWRSRRCSAAVLRMTRPIVPFVASSRARAPAGGCSRFFAPLGFVPRG